ncbi:hypothetical protein [Nonomuraea sp. NPDC049709]|uniref:hypothetical protein n=1 Tax=Nonomuraea sp. NPDC049709 TaxID=3154736 RepID=UPI0034461279
MKLLGESFATVTLSDDAIWICGVVDEVRQGAAINVERSLCLLYGSVKIAAPCVDDANAGVNLATIRRGKKSPSDRRNPLGAGIGQLTV